MRKPLGITTFHVLPRRWVVERTFAWIVKCRRLDRDYERLPETSEAMIKRATIGLMVPAFSASPRPRSRGRSALRHPHRNRMRDDSSRNCEPQAAGFQTSRTDPLSHSAGYSRGVPAAANRSDALGCSRNTVATAAIPWGHLAD
ncbi:transposase [Mycolicibacterium litorale]|uniref:Transposase n=1 Tax=Candidatus Mycolicibacterium alkanivorans TaxID=2954114 RepID=A0ABS9YXH5_9MYCO|nr:transposase [Candidatus Mycolicibacterium alkanivorans]